MFKDVYDLHAERRDFISSNPNRRNVYLNYDFIIDKNDMSLIFVETELKGRKLTSIEPEEREKIFQMLLDKHEKDVALSDIKVLLLVNDGFGKPYGYQWNSGNFSINEYIKKLDDEECEIFIRQLDI